MEPGKSQIKSQISSSALVRRLWQYCNVLRDDGLSYPDYVEQLTYLLFLKMADEQQDGPIPDGHGWSSFAHLDAVSMHRRYSEVLMELGRGRGTLRLIFRNAKNKIQDPAKLRFLVADLIGATEWTGLSADVKGDAYEGLLEKNARDTKSGAGQYFTPRPLIEAIVECVDPKPGEVVCDPACGTGGFLLAAREHVVTKYPEMTDAELEHLRAKAIRGVELVEQVARLATMNLLLHGISGRADDDLPIRRADSLASAPEDQVDVVITNPPFGIRGSVTYTQDGKSRRTADDLTTVRADFWVKTANKQLNFLQHVLSLLKPGGRAAVVLPDNVLYEGGAGSYIRRRLLETCKVHTLLRLPAGLFYAQGVKSNVLFFEKEAPGISGTAEIFVYDLRTDNRFSLKTKPLSGEDLFEFVETFHARGSGMTAGSRWRSFKQSEVLASEECCLDLVWNDDVEMTRSALGRLDTIAGEIAADLQSALGHLMAATWRER